VLLGTTGFFLLPAEELVKISPRGRPFEREVHDFLLTNYNGYTFSTGENYGHWQDALGRDELGQHREYRVALPTAEARRQLELFLASLAHDLGEDCIYTEIGSEAWLINAQSL
jgi:hypothetical protein